MACAYYSLSVYSASGYFHVEGEQVRKLGYSGGKKRDYRA